MQHTQKCLQKQSYLQSVLSYCATALRQTAQALPEEAFTRSSLSGKRLVFRHAPRPLPVKFPTIPPGRPEARTPQRTPSPPRLAIADGVWVRSGHCIPEQQQSRYGLLHNRSGWPRISIGGPPVRAHARSPVNPRGAMGRLGEDSGPLGKGLLKAPLVRSVGLPRSSRGRQA